MILHLADIWHGWLDPLQGNPYAFWSGFGSDFGEVTIVVAVIGWWHHVNCVEKGCWRKGHSDPEHGHPVCSRHSPRLP
jgi:hypothetical protein